MKDGNYAIYMGKEYMSGKNKDGKIILRSTSLKDIENGFELCEPFSYKNSQEDVVCVKYVNRSDVEDYYRLRTKVLHAGYEFDVIDEKDNRISIVAMTGDYREWLNLGMQCIDKGVYQKWIYKDEAEIKIEKERL